MNSPRERRECENGGGFPFLKSNNVHSQNTVKSLYFTHKKCLTMRISWFTTWWFWSKLSLHDVSPIQLIACEPHIFFWLLPSAWNQFNHSTQNSAHALSRIVLRYKLSSVKDHRFFWRASVKGIHPFNLKRASHTFFFGPLPSAWKQFNHSTQNSAQALSRIMLRSKLSSVKNPSFFLRASVKGIHPFNL